MVTKEMIDIYFIKTYDKLVNITNYFMKCQNKEKNMDATIYISEAYIYLVDNKNKIPSEKDINNWCFRMLSTSTKWTGTSSVNNKHLINNNEYADNQIEEIFEIDSDEEILKNKDIELKISAIEIYKQTTNKENKIVFDCYFKKEKNSVRKLAKHLGIKHTPSHKLIKEFKSEINNIYNNLKQNEA